MRSTFTLFLATSLSLSTAHLTAQQRRYVDSAVASPGNGSSWASAFRLLEQALAVSAPGDEVWVAAGTYAGGFDVPAGVTLLGGFRPGDVAATERNGFRNRTFLDGGDTQRVLRLRDRGVVDGFFVVNGHAGTPGGGGALVDGVSPVIRNTVFRRNSQASGIGSALLVVNGGTPTVENCLFVENGASGTGHCVDLRGSGGLFANVVIHGNNDNGLFFSGSAFPRIVNCVFARNSGRGICDEGTNNQPLGLENNLFFGNAVSHMHYRGTEYRDIAQVNAIPYARNNIAADPAFVDAGNLDFRSSASSPLVDAGLTSAATAFLDLAGNSRLLDGDLDGRLAVDIGAIERANIAMAIAGEPRPGNGIRTDLTGTTGLISVLVIGAERTQGLLVDPFGYWFLAPAAPLVLVPTGSLPAALALQVPTELAPGTRVFLQALAASPSGVNVSNPLDVRVR